MNYITTAAALQRGGIKWRGRDWCRYNNFTKRLEWLYVEEELRSEMEEAWQKFEDDGGCTNFTANPDEKIDEEIEENTPPQEEEAASAHR